MENTAKRKALKELIRQGTAGIRDAGDSLEQVGQSGKARARDYLRSFEASQTSDPEDTVLGPALAAGSSMVRDFLLPEDDMAGPRGAAPGIGKTMLGGARGLDAKALARLADEKRIDRAKEAIPTNIIKDARTEAKKAAEDPHIVMRQQAEKAKSAHTQDMIKELQGKVTQPMGGWESLSRKQLEQMYSVRHEPEVMNKILQAYGK